LSAYGVKTVDKNVFFNDTLFEVISLHSQVMGHILFDTLF